MKFMEDELKGFRFNVTPEIQNIMIDLLVHKQLLEALNCKIYLPYFCLLIYKETIRSGNYKKLLIICR